MRKPTKSELREEGYSVKMNRHYVFYAMYNGEYLDKRWYCLAEDAWAACEGHLFNS